MTITMQSLERLSLAEMKEFIEGRGRVRLVAEGWEAVYGFIERVLKAQQYRRISKGKPSRLTAGIFHGATRPRTSVCGRP